MYKFNAKLSAAVAMVTFIATAFAPVGTASTAVNVTGNGAFSATHVSVHTSSHSSINQSNSTFIVTGVNTTSNTGNNSSDFNTGGSSSVKTGNTTTVAAVNVTGSSNTATDPKCGCQNGNTTVNVSQNGAFSWNSIHVSNHTSSTVNQTNETAVITGVNVVTNTGNNSASFNTGGSSGVQTGGSSTGVIVDVSGSSNTVH